MDAIFEEKTFDDFGEDHLYPYHRTGLRSVEAEAAEQLKQHIRTYAPRSPGVYGMLDPKGRLVYVGKSKCLRNRLLSYFLPNNEEDKSGRIVQSTRTIVWEPQPSDFAALLREQFLIRQFQPRFNVQGIPRRQQSVFICLGRQPAEQFYTAKKPDPKATLMLGPLTGAGRAARAVEVLNRLYQLRDCNSSQPCSFTDQLQLFDIDLRPGCIRLEIQSCLGPCISACSRKEYERQVERAKAFLTGNCDLPLQQIDDLIAQAAKNLHFEQAAVLREDFRSIQWLHRRTVDLANARENFTFVYQVPADSEFGQSQSIWYLIRKGMIEGAVAPPRTPAELEQTTRLLMQWRRSDNCVGNRFSPRPESLALVTSWFKKNHKELKRTFVPTPMRIARNSQCDVNQYSAGAPSDSRNPRPKRVRTSANNGNRKTVKI